MSAGRALGVVLIVAGLGLGLVGVAGAAGAFRAPVAAVPSPSPVPVGPTPSATATDPPMDVPSPTPSAATSSVPTLEPTLEPTPDVEGLVRAFFVEIETTLRAGRAEDMYDALAPAVIERYGADACQAELESRPPEPTRTFDIQAVLSPAPWDYVTDERSTTIPDAITVLARVITPTPTGDQSAMRELHVQLVDGAVRWFTDCGTPPG